MWQTFLGDGRYTQLGVCVCTGEDSPTTGGGQDDVVSAGNELDALVIASHGGNLNTVERGVTTGSNRC